MVEWMEITFRNEKFSELKYEMLTIRKSSLAKFFKVSLVLLYYGQSSMICLVPILYLHHLNASEIRLATSFYFTVITFCSPHDIHKPLNFLVLNTQSITTTTCNYERVMQGISPLGKQGRT